MISVQTISMQNFNQFDAKSLMLKIVNFRLGY